MNHNPENYQKLEDDIHAIWGIKDIISTFLWRYLDHPKPMTEDEVWNHIHAIECLLDMHCEKIMDTYCRVFQLNQYASEETKARRAEILKGLANTGGSLASKKKAKKK